MGGTMLLLFWGGLFGAMLLILVFGYKSIEEEREKAENARAAEPVAERPRFFVMTPVDSVQPQVASPASASTYDEYVDSLVLAIESHIRNESAATSAFVAEPSLARLFGLSGPPTSTIVRRVAGQDREKRAL